MSFLNDNYETTDASAGVYGKTLKNNRGDFSFQSAKDIIDLGSIGQDKLSLKTLGKPAPLKLDTIDSTNVSMDGMPTSFLDQQAFAGLDIDFSKGMGNLDLSKVDMSNMTAGQLQSFKQLDAMNNEAAGKNGFMGKASSVMGVGSKMLGVASSAFSIYAGFEQLNMMKEQMGMAKEQWQETKQELARVKQVRNANNAHYSS